MANEVGTPLSIRVNLRATPYNLVIARSEATKQSSRSFRWIAAVGGASLLMNTPCLSLRRRDTDCGNPRISAGSPRRSASRDDKACSLPSPSKNPRLVCPLAMTHEEQS